MGDLDVNLTKHQALGNDFLVLLAGAGRDLGELAERAVRWCARRRGIGADGLLVNTGTLDQPRMVLFNADGSRAEMSGNGIRCFAQALAMATATPRGAFDIVTDAGLRVVELHAAGGRDTISASVSMGAVTAIEPPVNWHLVGADPMRPVAHLSLGNPHSVVAVEDVFDVDLVELGSLVPEVNLEVVMPGPEPHAITMRVHERGAGITEACGTGATASAVAALRWGMVERGSTEVLVHMDGGDAVVRLADEAVLVGPSVFIASIDVAW